MVKVVFNSAAEKKLNDDCKHTNLLHYPGFLWQADTID